MWHIQSCSLHQICCDNISTHLWRSQAEIPITIVQYGALTIMQYREPQLTSQPCMHTGIVHITNDHLKTNRGRQ